MAYIHKVFDFTEVNLEMLKELVSLWEQGKLYADEPGYKLKKEDYLDLFDVNFKVYKLITEHKYYFCVYNNFGEPKISVLYSTLEKYTMYVEELRAAAIQILEERVITMKEE